MRYSLIVVVPYMSHREWRVLIDCDGIVFDAIRATLTLDRLPLFCTSSRLIHDDDLMAMVRNRFVLDLESQI